MDRLWHKCALTSAFGLTAVCLVVAQNGSNATEGDQGYLLRQSVRRVLVDVVVTDSQGRPVPGLTAADFHLSEDGKAQNIRGFDVHTSERASSAPLQLPVLPAHTFMNVPVVADNASLTVILYDVLNTPLDAQAYAHKELVKFLKQHPARNLTAVFVLSDHLHLLQGFTADTSELSRAVNGKAGAMRSSTWLQGAGEAEQSSQMQATVAASPAAGAASGQAGQNGRGQGPGGTSATGSAAPATMESALAHMEGLEASAMLDRRVEITLDGLGQVARFLSGVPGRKNLIWLSGSFPVNVMPDTDAALGGDDQKRNYSDELKKTSDLLNAGEVAVYPVDVRGLQVNPMFDASSRQSFGAGSAGVQAHNKAVQQFVTQQAADHATMDQIGEVTGGGAFYNTNGLNEAMQAATEDGNNYYSLTYAPSNANFDGRLRHINVTLDKKGYRLAYRRSYFADDVGKLKPMDLTSETPEPGSLESAMQFGSPPAHELLFAARVDTKGSPAPATAGQMAGLKPYMELKAKTNHQKFVSPKEPVQLQAYVVQYALLAHQLELPTGDDHVYRPQLEFAALAYDKNGNPLSGIQTSITDAIAASQMDEVKAKGYHAVQVVFVPIEAVSLRLAVRDGLTDRIGSMEVRLPLPPSAESSAAVPAH